MRFDRAVVADPQRDRTQSEAGRLFKAMQERVERSGTDAVSMMRQFLHHGETEDWLLRSVHQHMDANQAVKELALLVCHKNKYTAGTYCRP